MSQATKFYLPFFKTGKPFGKLYTYVSGTLTPAPTYSNAQGTLNSNPVIMDEDGDCVLYINSDIAYRYILRDAAGNLIYDNSNIKQMNGAPGAPGGPQGEKGPQGKRGVQGISGGQGPVGFQGATGDRGLPYLTKLLIASDQGITIPSGISEIYITATGGGGAGASWSPYVLLSRYKTSGTPFSVSPSFRRQPELTTASAENSQTYSRDAIATLIMIPGSGMSGQCVYKKKIELDKTRDNFIQIFLGAGGLPDPNSLDGQDGQETNVFVNGVKVLTLAGGLGGKNFFPKTSAFPALPTNGTPIRLNRGNKNGMLYFSSASATNSFTTVTGAQYIWPTSYRKKSGNSWVSQRVELSYQVPRMTISGSASIDAFTTLAITEMNGASGIFNDYYQFMQSKLSTIQDGQPSSDAYKNSLKSGSGEIGWGSGGDVFWNPSSSQSLVNTYNHMFPDTTGTITKISLFNDKEIKETIIKYMREFRMSDSFNTGVLDIPALNDDSGLWANVDNEKAIALADATSISYVNSGFYTNWRTPVMSKAPQSQGGNGVKGFAILEYGDIKDNKPD